MDHSSAFPDLRPLAVPHLVGGGQLGPPQMVSAPSDATGRATAAVAAWQPAGWGYEDGAWDVSGFELRATLAASPKSGGDPSATMPLINSDPGTDQLTRQQIISGIDQAFSDVLGRGPGASDINYWYPVAGNYDSWALLQFEHQIRGSIAYWQEAADDINGVFQAILNRPIDGNGQADVQGQLASGATTIAGFRTSVARSQEAANDINGLYMAVLGRGVDPGGLTTWQNEFSAGWTQAQVRTTLANSAEAAGKIDATWVAEAGFHVSSEDQSYWQGQLAAGSSLANLRQALAYYAPTIAAIDAAWVAATGSHVPAGNLSGWQNWFAGGAGPADLRYQLAYNYQPTVDAINALYEQVAGPQSDPSGLANYRDEINAGQTLTQIRGQVAHSPEVAGDIATLYASLLGRAPSADETAGFEAALGSVLTNDPHFVVSGQSGTLAVVDGNTLVTELPVYVTLNSGVTPTLTDPNGNVIRFSDAMQMAAFSFAYAIRSDEPSADLTSAYAATTNWLIQVNQPMLQAGEGLIQAAASARASGNSYLANLDSTAARVDLAIAATPTGTPVNRFLNAAQQFVSTGNQAVSQGNWDVVALMQAGADVCLQLSQMSPPQQMIYAERVYQKNGATTIDVGVDPTSVDPYGTATFHSKDQSGGIGSFLEPLLTAVLDLAAVIPGPQQVFTIPAAAAVNAGEAAQQFADGNTLPGVLDLGTAAGFGALGAGYQGIAGDIFAATAIVGGSAGVVQTSQQGNALGVAAGVLEVAAGVAGGLISLDEIPQPDVPAVQNLSVGLGVAGGAVGGANAIAHGDIADGLLEFVRAFPRGELGCSMPVFQLG